MDYIYTTLALTTFTVGAVLYNHYSSRIDYDLCKAAVSNVANKFMKKLTGVSSLHRVRNSYIVKTDLGPLKVNYHKMPSLDTEVYLFDKGHLLDEIKQNQMMDKIEFLDKYGRENTTQFRTFNFGIIADIYYPKDFKNKDKLTGFIFNVLEDDVYVFVFDENNIIDYKKLFQQYEDELSKVFENDKGDESGVDELIRINSHTDVNEID